MRVQYGEQVWRRRIESWRQSGLSQKAFCAEKQLALSTFSLWRKRLNETSRVSACLEVVPVPRFQAAIAPTHLSSAQPAVPPVVVVTGGGRYRLELTEGFQRDTLHAVLQVLEGRG